MLTGDLTLLIGVQTAVIATGLVAGVFLTFSDFIMGSLSASQPIVGAEAMQQINRKVYGSAFLALLLGMTGGSALLLIVGVIAGGPAAAWLIAGGGLYLVGVFMVSAVGNIPMNKRLDALKLGEDETAVYWIRYTRTWTWLNHIRTASSIVAANCFLTATQHL